MQFGDAFKTCCFVSVSRFGPDGTDNPDLCLLGLQKGGWVRDQQ